MLEPMSIADRQDRDHRNRQKYTSHSRQFFTSENREDHRQRM